MAEKMPQSFANHTRFDPPFHFFIIPVFAITVIIAIVHLVMHPSLHAAWLVVFSIAAAMGTAATAIVSRAYGARDTSGYRIGAKESASVTMILGFAIALLCALIAPVTAHWILPANDHRSIELMGKYLFAYGLGLPAVYMIQSLAGALRGIGETRVPMLVNLGGYWMFGLPVGYLLCFHAGRGVAGLWWGLTLALVAIALVLLYSWDRRSRKIPVYSVEK